MQSVLLKYRNKNIATEKDPYCRMIYNDCRNPLEYMASFFIIHRLSELKFPLPPSSLLVAIEIVKG